MPRKKRFVLCVRNGPYKASLQPRKIYRVLADAAAEARNLLRVIDESGEDYLYPSGLFVPIEVPAKAALAFVAAIQPAPTSTKLVRRKFGVVAVPGQPVPRLTDEIVRDTLERTRR